MATKLKSYTIARPVNYPHNKPDPEECRCMECNSNGLNKTGKIGTGFLQTRRETTILGYKCPFCEDGWRVK